MAKFVEIDEINQTICEALGINPNQVLSIVMQVRPNAWPVFTIEMLGKGEINALLKRYELRPKEVDNG